MVKIMGEIECSEKCGNLTDQPNETMCDTCIDFDIAIQAWINKMTSEDDLHV